MPDIKEDVSHLLGTSFSVWNFGEAIQSMEAGCAVKTQLRFS
jgi:hypothetical protein